MSEIKRYGLLDLKCFRTAQVKRRDLIDWVNKNWFPNFIKHSFCLVESGEFSKIGVIVDVVEKETNYQILGESISWN